MSPHINYVTGIAKTLEGQACAAFRKRSYMILMVRNCVGCFSCLLIFFCLLGCSSVISKSVLKSVDRSITFQDLQRNPDQYVGKMVLLGGQIAGVTVKKEETLVEVVQKPLSGEEPKNEDMTYGRFLVLFKGFLEPETFPTGRKITVAGEVQGKRVLLLDQLQYSYPVIHPKEYHVWNREEEVGHGPQFSIGVGVGIVR